VKRKTVVLAGHRKEGAGKSIPEAHPEAPLPWKTGISGAA